MLVHTSPHFQPVAVVDVGEDLARAIREVDARVRPEQVVHGARILVDVSIEAHGALFGHGLDAEVFGPLEEPLQDGDAAHEMVPRPALPALANLVIAIVLMFDIHGMLHVEGS